MRHLAIVFCVLSIYLAAGGLRAGVTHRAWDEAGTVLTSDSPPARLAGILGLTAFGAILWVLIRLADRGEGWWPRDLLADAAQFLGAAGLLFGVVVVAGMSRPAAPVAPAYRWFLALDLPIVAACFRSARLLRAGRHGKAKVDPKSSRSYLDD